MCIRDSKYVAFTRQKARVHGHTKKRTENVLAANSGGRLRNGKKCLWHVYDRSKVQYNGKKNLFLTQGVWKYQTRIISFLQKWHSLCTDCIVIGLPVHMLGLMFSFFIIVFLNSHFFLVFIVLYFQDFSLDYKYRPTITL